MIKPNAPSKINYAAFFLLVLAMLVPLVIKSSYAIRILIMIGYYSVMSYGWDIIGGDAGQISLGNAAFFAIGAYSAAISYLYIGINPAFGAIAGVVIAMSVALGLGVVVLRLRGPYFTLSTLAAAEVLRILLLHFKDQTGGAEGLVIPYNGHNFSALQFASDEPYYYMVLALVVIAFLVSFYAKKSKLGMQLSAIRNDEDAAESLGINLMGAKVKALIIAAGITSLAGAFYVIYDHYIDPYSVAGHDISIKILLITLVGGRRSVWGPLLGAAVLVPLIEATNSLLGSVRAGTSMLVYSIVLILVVLFAPNGLIRLFDKKGKASVSKVDSAAGKEAR